MVNWKSGDSTNRLIAAIIAASPGNKIDYNAVAALFGQGATYDSIEGQCRKYRKMAEELRTDATKQRVSIAGTPRSRGKIGTRTPQEAQSRVTKPLSASPTKGKTGVTKTPNTPTKKRAKNNVEGSLMDADIESNNANVGAEPMNIIPSIEEAKFEPPTAKGLGSFVGVVVPTKVEEVTATDKEKEAMRSRRSQAPTQDSDTDDYVNSRENSPSAGRGRARTRRPRTASATAKYVGYDFGFVDEEFA
ncbi:uncharacterized protein APUU_11768S [Aspergillus puulaauensis]|uniref:Uncharacterized protein n=1 Tax=Aspergillus puulaauensis TaxID=1220207 RepID=A0A7R8AIR3_9EURO|nr:uncharacterized protein APUU_11768S [Aspergillus puulaauensis]BCS18940.1 hypothetical protein APUU_11768S [Aspergillus puulaauensis]